MNKEHRQRENARNEKKNITTSGGTSKYFVCTTPNIAGSLFGKKPIRYVKYMTEKCSKFT